MTDPLERLDALRRPRLLVRAARFGLDDYRRERDLPRLLPGLGTPAPARALPLLLAAEAEAEAQRVAGGAAYSAARHVELLIAVMGEARMLAAASAPANAPHAPAAPAAEAAAAARPQAKASGISALRRAT